MNVREDAANRADGRQRAGAAAAYDRHVGRYGAELARGMVEIAGVERGQHVLDVGCGPGPLTVALAACAGADGVAAVDPSADYVTTCRARVPGADVRVAVAEQLPFGAQAFDAVLAQLVVQLVRDRDAALAEMVRVVRPGGVVTACVWDATTMPLLRAFWDAALAVAPDRAGALDGGRRVGYDDAGMLAGLWRAHGLADVATGELRVRADYESFDELFAPFSAGTGHSGQLYAALDTGEQRRVRAGANRRLGAPGGPFTLQARAWWVRGRRPEP